MKKLIVIRSQILNSIQTFSNIEKKLSPWKTFPIRHTTWDNTTKDSLRHGQWIIFYDSLGTETTRESPDISHYCLMEIENGKPQGQVECFYPDGIRSWVGRMISIDPEIKHGRAISYHFNGSVATKSFYQNDTIDGSYQTFHPNGILESEGMMTKGLKTGLWSFFYENGNLMGSIDHQADKEQGYIEILNDDGTLNSRGHFVDGLQDGYWEVYYSSGVLANKGSYKAGLKQDEWVFYHENGQISEVASYTDDSINGSYLNYYDNGQLKTRGQYVKNLGEGHFDYFHENGQLSGAGLLKENLYQGSWTFYYENGAIESEGTYIDDLKEGTWQYYHDNKRLNRTMEYKAGKLNGKSVYYWPNGQFNAKGEYIDDLEQGRWEYYYENGVGPGYETFDHGVLHGPAKRISSNNQPQNMGEYSQGKREGYWEFYHDNGMVSSTGNYLHDQKHGYFVYFNDNGNKKSEGNYQYDLREGKWSYYYPNGNLYAQGLYEEGNSVGHWKYYYENGLIWKEGEEVTDTPKGEWVFYNERGQLRSRGSYQGGLLEGPHLYYDSVGNLEKEAVFFQGVSQNFFNLYDSVDNLSLRGQMDQAWMTIEKAEEAFYDEYEKNALKKTDLYELFAALHMRSGEYKKAEKYYKKSLKHTLKYKADTSSWYTSTLDDLADLYTEQEHYQQAYDTYVETLNKIRARKDGILSDEYAQSLRYQAIALMNLNRRNEALYLLEQDLKYRQQLDNQQENIAALYFNLIDAIYGQSDKDESKLYGMINSSIAFHQENGMENHWTFPSNFYYKALMQRDHDELDSAYQSFAQCILFNSDNNDTISIEFVNSLIHLGNYHYNKLEYAQSGKFYRRALVVAENPTLKNTWVYLNTIKSLSNQYWVEDDYNNTLKYNKLLVDLSRVSGKTSELGQGYTGMALAYENLGSEYDREARANHLKAIETLATLNGFQTSYVNANLLYADYLSEKEERNKADQILNQMDHYVNSQPEVDRFYKYRIINDRAYNFFQLYAYDSAEYYALKVVNDLKDNPGKSLLQYIECYRLLGDIKNNFNKDEEAITYYFQALNETEKYLGTEHELYYGALLEVAASFANQYNPTSSIQYYLKAIDLGRKIRGEQRILTSRIYLAEQYANNQEYSKAMDQLTFVKRFLEEQGDTKSANYIWCLRKIGEVYEAQGDYETGESYVQDALAIGEKIYAKNSRDYGTLMRRVGQFYLRNNEYELAYQYVVPAIEIVENTLGDKVVLYAWYAETMSEILYGLEDYAAAINLLEKAADIYLEQIGPERDYMDALYTLGKMLADVGQYEKSIDVLEKSRNAVLQKYGRYSFAYTVDTKEIARTLLISKKTKEALEALTEVKNLYDSIGVKPNSYPSLYNFMGWAHLDLDHFEQAREYYQLAIQMADSIWGIGSGASQVYRNNLAFYYLESGDFEEAEALWLQVKNQFNTSDISSVSWLDNMAMLYTSWGKYDQAKTYWDQALGMLLSRIRNDFPLLSERGKAAFWDAYKSDFMIFNTYVINAYRQGDQQALAQMYDNQLQTKSLLLNSSTKERKRILNSGNRSLIETYYQYVNLKEDLVKYYGYSNERLAQENINIAKLEQRAESLEKALSFSSSEENSSKSKVQTWRTIQRTLLPDEAAVELIRIRHFDRVLQDSVLYAAMILTSETTTGPVLEILSNGNFLEEKAIKIYRSSIEYNLKDSKSYSAFWKPIDQLLKGKKKVYLSSDGVFHQLNVATLLTDDNTYVRDHYDIQQVSSTRALVELKKKTRRNENNAAYIFGNPKFDLSHTLIESDMKERGLKSRSYTRATSLDRFSFVELPGTKIETETVNGVLQDEGWETNLYLEEKALEEELRRVNNPGILHIATHGFFLDQPNEDVSNIQLGVQSNVSRKNPLLRSGLLLTGATQTARGQSTAAIENGIFTAYEAMSLDLFSTRLVVLSACETGLGEIKNGEGVFGLQRAFQIAGAKSILMSLWKVDDTATQLLMTSFYKAWLAGATEAEALSKAQSVVRASYPDPKYWGAFVLISG